MKLKSCEVSAKCDSGFVVTLEALELACLIACLPEISFYQGWNGHSGAMRI